MTSLNHKLIAVTVVLIAFAALALFVYVIPKSSPAASSVRDADTSENNVDPGSQGATKTTSSSPSLPLTTFSPLATLMMGTITGEAILNAWDNGNGNAKTFEFLVELGE